MIAIPQIELAAMVRKGKPYSCIINGEKQILHWRHDTQFKEGIMFWTDAEGVKHEKPIFDTGMDPAEHNKPEGLVHISCMDDLDSDPSIYHIIRPRDIPN